MNRQTNKNQLNTTNSNDFSEFKKKIVQKKRISDYLTFKKKGCGCKKH